MTPKEKAEQLVIKMYQPLPASKEAEKGKEHLNYNQYNAAKQCALIAVDEILNYDLNAKCESQFEIEKRLENYWQEVKQELQKL